MTNIKKVPQYFGGLTLYVVNNDIYNELDTYNII